MMMHVLSGVVHPHIHAVVCAGLVVHPRMQAGVCAGLVVHRACRSLYARVCLGCCCAPAHTP